MQLPKDTPQHILDQVPPHLHPGTTVVHGKTKRHKPRVSRGIVVQFTFPAVTRSEANLGGKLKAKIRRKTEVKNAALGVVNAFVPIPREHLPWLSRYVVVRLARLGGRFLDGDNLARSLKPIRDVVAEQFLHRDDGDPDITWKYEQLPGWAEGVRVTVTFAEGPP